MTGWFPCYLLLSQMIRSFGCPETERLFADETSRRLPTQIQRGARRKLLLRHQARRLDDLRAPPGKPAGIVEGRPSGPAQHPHQ